MRNSDGQCRCKSCLEKQYDNAVNYSPQFQAEVKELFKSFDIQTMTESLKMVFDIALYQSEEPIDTPQKNALHQVDLLREGLEALGKS